MKNRLLIFAASLYLATFPSFAQYPFHLSDPPSKLYLQGFTYVPSALTELTSKTLDVDLVIVSNKTASAVTFLIQDETTNCNSDVCQWIPTVSIAGNTSYIINIPGGIRSVGVKWQAGSANALVAQVRGSITP